MNADSLEMERADVNARHCTLLLFIFINIWKNIAEKVEHSVG